MAQWIYIILVFFGLYIFANVYWVTGLGLALATVEVIYFFKNVDKGFLFYRYVLLFALLQWIVAPFFDYLYFNTHYLYHMYVPESIYMSLIVPGLYAFKIGLDLFGRRSESTFFLWRNIAASCFEQYRFLGFLLLFTGIIFYLLGQSGVGGSLAFAFYLLGNLKYVGGLVLLFSNYQHALKINLGLILWLFIDSLRGGMFHEFILWTLLLLPFIFLKFSITTLHKASLFIAFITCIFIIQAVKEEYRNVVWYSKGQAEGNFSTFADIVDKRHTTKGVASEDEFHSLNIRFNQGWIISRILYYVPSHESFADGGTINEAIFSSFLPRFLNPDKQGAGGQKNFKRFTGLKLHGSTSMGTSIIGEAYANYGQFGTFVFMFLWGLFLGYIIFLHVNLSIKYPILLFFIPWVFIECVKAETDFVTVLNYIIKAYTLLTVIFVLLKSSGLLSKQQALDNVVEPSLISNHGVDND